MMDWKECELSGHLVCDDFWIMEINGIYELSERDIRAWDGFSVLGKFTTLDEAKRTAENFIETVAP